MKVVKPKFLFVLSNMLGWRTYGSQISKVASARHDVSVEFVYVDYPFYASSFCKKNYPTDNKLKSNLRLFDPISLMSTRIKNLIDPVLRAGDFQGVHVAAHTLAGALCDDKYPPFTLAMDHTRKAINSSFSLSDWNDADIKRETKVLSSASKLYPMSSWCSSSLELDYKIKKSKISISPPSREVADTRPNRNFDKVLPIVLFIGNDLKRKGLFKLLDCLEPMLGNKLDLHIVSRNAPKFLDEIQGVSVFRSYNNLDVMNLALPNANVLCLPSQYDMSPQVLVEAAATGVPCVATDIAGIPDLVLDGKTGFLSKNNEMESFAAAILTLCQDRSLNESMGNEAYQYAKRGFCASTNYNRLLDDMLENGSS